MSHASTVHVPTSNAGRYLQQLCKHWTHNLAVEVTADKGTVVFPANGRAGTWPGDATLTLIAHEETLEMGLECSAPGQLDVLKTAVEKHLDRFAFREAPLTYDWQDA